MDSVSIEAVNKVLGNPLPDAEALIIVEVDGETDGETDEVVSRDLKIVEEVAWEQKAKTVTPSFDKDEILRWTNARKAVLSSLSALKPGYSCVSLADDMGVPVSCVPEAVSRFQAIAKANDVTVAVYGHASDGNLHSKMLLRVEDEDEWRRGLKAASEIFEASIDLGGTVTGEHGVGLSKAKDFQKERASEMSTILVIKQAFDPQNILNPGKAAQWRGDQMSGLRYPCPGHM